MSDSHSSDAARLMRLVDGFVTTQLLYVVAKLGIAPLLAAGPKTTDELAATVGVDAGLLHRVLRGLALEDVVDERDDGRFELTSLGRELITLEATAIVRGEVYYPAAGRLFEAVTNGGVPFERYHGHRFFEYFAHNPEQEALFQTSMAARSQREAAAVVAAHDFSQYGTLVDVGGGGGVLLAAILKSAPALRGILFDLDASIPAAQAYLREVGVDDRVECVGGDFFDGRAFRRRCLPHVACAARLGRRRRHANPHEMPQRDATRQPVARRGRGAPRTRQRSTRRGPHGRPHAFEPRCS